MMVKLTLYSMIRYSYCPADNRDARKLDEMELDEESRLAMDDPEVDELEKFDIVNRELYNSCWFACTYKPEMQNTLRNALTHMTTRHQHIHGRCLGQGPRIDVEVQEVGTSSQANYCTW